MYAAIITNRRHLVNSTGMSLKQIISEINSSDVGCGLHVLKEGQKLILQKHLIMQRANLSLSLQLKLSPHPL